MTAAAGAFVVREDDRGLVFDVLVQPRASRPRLGPVHGDRLKLAVTARRKTLRVRGVDRARLDEVVRR